MTTRNLVPRANSEGKLGTDEKRWLEVNADGVYASNNVLVFNSVAEMKASNKVKAGYTIKTLGFYKANDGGGADYLVTDDIGEDEASVITLQKGLYAKLLIKDVVNVSCFGAYGDNIHDDSTYIQKAIDKCPYGLTVELDENRTYLINTTIKVPRGINFNGKKAVIKLTKTFKDEYAIIQGETDVSNIGEALGWFPQSSLINNINIQCYDTSLLLNGIYVNKDCKIENIFTWGLNKTIDTNTTYIDMVEIKDVVIAHKVGDDFAINTGYLGDARKIQRIHMCEFVDGKYNLLVVGSGHNSIVINQIINGNIKIKGSNVNVKGLHLERGDIEINEATVNIESALIWKYPNIRAIKIKNKSNVTLKNIIIAYKDTISYVNDDFIDIESTTNTNTYNGNTIKITNCYKNMLATNIEFRNLAGIKTNIDSFNNNKSLNSTNSLIRYNKTLTNIPCIKREGSYSILSTIYTDGNFKWDIETGMYYYKAILIYDMNRQVGDNTNSTELSKEKDTLDNSFLISTNGTINSDILLYRGTSTGVYNKKCKVSTVTGGMVDIGSVCNGEKWEDNDNNDVLEILDADYYKLNADDTVIVKAQTIPTVGTWKKGDIIINVNPSASTPYGWVCVADGTPGTWKVISNLGG